MLVPASVMGKKQKVRCRISTQDVCIKGVKPELYWMFVDPLVHPFVKDVEQEIVKKFFTSCVWDSNVSIQLRQNGAVLPSWESSDIFVQDDVIQIELQSALSVGSPILEGSQAKGDKEKTDDSCDSEEEKESVVEATSGEGKKDKKGKKKKRRKEVISSEYKDENKPRKRKRRTTDNSSDDEKMETKSSASKESEHSTIQSVSKCTEATEDAVAKKSKRKRKRKKKSEKHSDKDEEAATPTPAKKSFVESVPPSPAWTSRPSVTQQAPKKVESSESRRAPQPKRATIMRGKAFKGNHVKFGSDSEDEAGATPSSSFSSGWDKGPEAVSNRSVEQLVDGSSQGKLRNGNGFSSVNLIMAGAASAAATPTDPSHFSRPDQPKHVNTSAPVASSTPVAASGSRPVATSTPLSYDSFATSTPVQHSRSGPLHIEKVEMVNGNPVTMVKRAWREKKYGPFPVSVSDSSAASCSGHTVTQLEANLQPFRSAVECQSTGAPTAVLAKLTEEVLAKSTALHGDPDVSCRLAYKTLEINPETCTPEVSDYKWGVVKSYHGATRTAELLLDPACRTELPEIWRVDEMEAQAADQSAVVSVCLHEMIEVRVLPCS